MQFSFASPNNIMYVAWLGLALPDGPQGSEVELKCIFSLLIHTKKLLLLTNPIVWHTDLLTN